MSLPPTHKTIPIMRFYRGFFIFSVIFVSIFITWDYFTNPRPEGAKFAVHQPGAKGSMSEGIWPPPKESRESWLKRSEEFIRNNPETMQSQMARLYQETFPNGDITQQNQMRLEDDWCIASSDLQASEYERYQEDLDEWLLARGNISLLSPTRNLDIPEQTRRNGAFIEPYETLPPTTLVQHASNNDLLALGVIAQRDDFPSHVKDKAAKQLLLLGDTSKGLSRLVMNELSQMEPLSDDNSNRQAITNRFIKVMAMVNYGLQRKDTSALQAFLIYAQKPDQLLKGSWPQDFITADNTQTITNVTNKLISDINLTREQVNLPPIEMENTSKIVEMHFQEKLAFLIHHYAKTLAQPWFPEEWNEQFIPDNPCMTRKIATTRFWQEQVPALQQRFLQSAKNKAQNSN